NALPFYPGRIKKKQPAPYFSFSSILRLEWTFASTKFRTHFDSTNNLLELENLAKRTIQLAPDNRPVIFAPAFFTYCYYQMECYCYFFSISNN
ncbi:hypothetical protein KAH55_12375, partial [bacterium]|nr:hypothetical protein [bacterium]